MNRAYYDVTTEWRVVWFPANAPQRTKTGTEAVVRQIAEDQAEWNPITEVRTISVTPWRTE